MAKQSIYVPQTGTMYPSAAAASSALGVDASNIGKVLRGQRQSAGGYNFVKVDPNVKQSKLQDINKTIDISLTEQQKRRQAKRRLRSRQRMLETATRAERAAQSKAARELRQTLVEANKLLKEYDKRGLSGISGVVPELERLKDIIGQNKRGGFNADLKNLKGFTEHELESLRDAITRQMNRKDFKDLEAQESRKQAIAYQLGLEVEELEKYTNLLPTLWHILDLASHRQEKGSDPPYDEIMDAMQAGIDPDALQEILLDIESETERYDREKEEAENSDIEMPSYLEFIDPYISEIREMREQLEQLEQEQLEQEQLEILGSEEGEKPEKNIFNGELTYFN